MELAVSTALRDPRLQPFAATSPFNTSLGDGAIYADDEMAAALRQRPATLASARWSISVVQATNADPLCGLTLPWGVWKVRIPTDARPGAGTDNHLSVIQPDCKTVVETWTMTKVDDTHWTSGYAVLTDLTGSGLVNGARASGISQMNGLIRKHEVAALHIPHALSISIDDTQLRAVGPDAQGNYGVWPARRQDGDAATAYSGPIPMGSMFAIPSTVNLAALGLTAEGLALGRALQDFGTYVLICGANVSLHADPTAERDLPDAVANMRTDFANVLRPLLLHVTNSAPGTVAGGGARRRPTAPPLAF